MTIDPAASAGGDNASPLVVSCTHRVLEDGTLRVAYKAQNTGSAAVHVFDSKRMPYLILDGKDSLLVLHGVNAPDPDLDIPMIEIPITRELAAGHALDGEVVVKPLIRRDHYSKDRKPTELRGKVAVRCQVGWGKTPITPQERHTMSITTLLKWQELSTSDTVEVDFGP